MKLSGVVRSSDGEPALSAVVEISNSSGDIVDQVQVDDAGRYTYHLSAGDWALRAWDAHGGGAREQVSLAEGEDKEVNIGLEPQK